MSTKRVLTIVLIASFVLLAVGISPRVADTVRALPPALAGASAQAGMTVPYPGSLADEAGQPVADGAYDFVFTLYETESGGEPLWTEAQAGVAVQNGAFTALLGSVNALPKKALDVGARWLEVAVRGPRESDFTALTPRQVLSMAAPASPASPAAGLACPHDHFGEQWTGSAATYGLRVDNSGGYGFLANTSVSGGIGVYGGSNGTTGSGAGVRGYSYSPNGLGGYFYNDYGGSGLKGSSTGRNGVEGYSTAPDVWAGVYGEAPHYGVLGRATTSSWYGVYSDGAMGTSGNLWVGGNLTVVGSKGGYVVDLAQNDDAVSLESGDVVVISGAGPAVVGETPAIKVRLAAAEGTSAVIGVVDQRYVSASAHDAGADSSASYDDAAIAPGEYLTVVTLGSFKAIKVDASYGAIAPGDLLVASSNPGYAMRAASPAPGTIIGKALGALESGAGVIPVIVTMQ